MNIHSVFYDPDLGSVSFTVDHVNYTRSREGIASSRVTEQARGCVHPGTAEVLKLLPEEEQHESYIVIYTDYPLSTGISENADAASFIGADRIHWNGQIWRVVKVRDWQGFGYVQALAVLVQEGE